MSALFKVNFEKADPETSGIILLEDTTDNGAADFNQRNNVDYYVRYSIDRTDGNDSVLVELVDRKNGDAVAESFNLVEGESKPLTTLVDTKPVNGEVTPNAYSVRYDVVKVLDKIQVKKLLVAETLCFTVLKVALNPIQRFS